MLVKMSETRQHRDSCGDKEEDTYIITPSCT